jgi:hypothetical protein
MKKNQKGREQTVEGILLTNTPQAYFSSKMSACEKAVKESDTPLLKKTHHPSSQLINANFETFKLISMAKKRNQKSKPTRPPLAPTKSVSLPGDWSPRQAVERVIHDGKHKFDFLKEGTIIVFVHLFFQRSMQRFAPIWRTCPMCASSFQTTWGLLNPFRCPWQPR